MIETNFGWALQHLKNGKRVLRQGWNGKGMWLSIQSVDQNSKMQRPYIYIKTAQDELVPWVASHDDLLGIDWDLA